MRDNEKMEVRELAEVVAEIAAALGDAAQLSARVWSQLANLDRRLAALEAEALRPGVVPPGWRPLLTADPPAALQ